MSYNAKNYTEQGGEKTIIGGEIEILSGATIKADEGATVEGFGGGGEYELPIATRETLGGVKTGGTAVRVDSDGVIYVTTCACQEESEAESVEELREDFNALLAKLKNCTLMDSE